MKKFGHLRKNLFFACLGVSLTLHLGVLWVLWANPFHFHSQSRSALMKPSTSPLLNPKDNETLLVERIERALEESLNDVVTIANAFPQMDEEPLLKPALAKVAPKVEEKELELMSYTEKSYTASMPPLFDPEQQTNLSEFALEDEMDPDLIPFAQEAIVSVDLVDIPTGSVVPHSVEDDFTMTTDQFSPSALSMEEYKDLKPQWLASLRTLSTDIEVTEELPTIATAEKEGPPPKLILPNSVDYLRKQWVKRSLAENTLPNIDHYGLDIIPTTLEWDEDFDVDIALRPTPDGNRYIFSLTLNPNIANDCREIPQNYYFLIDKTSSVGRQKFNRYKRAVLRSMAALQSGDNFQIIVFDKKIDKLADRPLPVTPKTIQHAEDYLERQTAKSHHSSNELYTSLNSLLPAHMNPHELHNIILITDGNTLLSPRRQKEALANWSTQFGRNIQFYTASAGKGNNLVLLDLLSYFSGGKLLYSDTNAAFPRKLVRLVKDLHSPLLSNIHVEVTTKDAQANLSLYPPPHLLPPLFASKPYTIVGTVDELCDLTLFFQGKNEGNWIHVQKNISLADADRGGKSLEKQWAEALSKKCYERFLKSGKKVHLAEAQKIVAPYNGVITQDE